jgi:hypothetical protein
MDENSLEVFRPLHIWHAATMLEGVLLMRFALEHEVVRLCRQRYELSVDDMTTREPTRRSQ